VSEPYSQLAADDTASASPRDLADLARAGYAILRQPLMQVTFEVHHVDDRPGYLADYLLRQESEGTAIGASFGETLTSSAGGLGLVVVTRAAVAKGSRRQYLSGGHVPCYVDDNDGSRIFRGTAHPNPSFIYESAWRFEGLISADSSAPKMRLWHSRVIRDAVQYVAKLASEVDSPILSLQAPAQTPPNDRLVRLMAAADEEATLTPASSIAVRFAIALQHPTAKTILWLSRQLEDYCVRRGLALWLADTRLGSRPGNWFTVCSQNLEMSRSSVSPRGDSLRRVDWCMPITLVGPARVGTMHSVMSFLSQYGDVGISSCSVIPLDDLLFIHFDLSVTDTAELERHNAYDSDEAMAASASPPAEALARMFEILGQGRRADRQRASAFVSTVGDFQCLIGPARRLRSSDERKQMAIWFSWQTQGIELDLAVPLGGLFRAFSDVGLVELAANGSPNWAPSSPNIEYLVCRNMGNSVLRGKGKLALFRDLALRRYPDNALESRPTNLCVSIEEAWRAQATQSGHSGIRELTVAWRECWLGHWSLPL
jgi:hypothetical protein